MVCHSNSRIVPCALVWIPLVTFAMPIGAQSGREEQIKRARQEKAEDLAPDQETKWERRLNRIEDNGVFESLKSGRGVRGWQPVLMGGTRSGNGTAFGTGYLLRDLAGGNLRWESTARITTMAGYKFDTRASSPRYSRNLIGFEGYLGYENSPTMDYHGPGPDSDKHGRTSFRFETTNLIGTIEIRPFRSRLLSIGTMAGGLAVNVGPGQRRGHLSTDEIYTEATTPGVQSQPTFFRGGGYVELDYRDNVLGPRSGGDYLAQYFYYDDLDFKRYSFQQFGVDLQQMIPYFNRSHVLALRATSVMTFAREGQAVPFYLQPALGGNRLLRGFRRYRFYDDNLVHFTTEHRWHAVDVLEMALFFDAGKVTPKRSQLNFHKLELAGGIGFRFKMNQNTVMRWEFGVSREGFQFWWSWEDPFTRLDFWVPKPRNY